MKKDFDNWNKKKQETDAKKKLAFFQVRDVFWVKMGINIGFEQDGKGQSFMRPILVIKKFNNYVFWGIPLTTKEKNGQYYYTFELKKIKRRAILSQLRLFDTKRLEQKIGKITTKDFTKIKAILRNFLE